MKFGANSPEEIIDDIQTDLQIPFLPRLPLTRNALFSELSF